MSSSCFALFFEEIIGITALPCPAAAGSALLCNGQNLLHNQIGTVWIYCHTMDNMNIKTVRFGCERHTGFRCAANCFLPLQQSQLRLRVLFAGEHAQRVGIGKRDLSSAETDQRLTLHVFQNAGDGFARRVDLAGQLFVGDTYGRAAA